MIHTNENKATQKDWDDFFAPENDPQTAFDTVDQDWLGLHMASEHGSGEEQETNQPVDATPFDYQGPPPGFVFDR